MTPAEYLSASNRAVAFKAARHALGLSARDMAGVLRLGVHGGRTVRRWEAGNNDIPGPAEVAVSYMLRHGLPDAA